MRFLLVISIITWCCPNIAIGQSAIISGKIKTFTGQLIENAEVTAIATHPQYPITVFTNDAGQYEFENNPLDLNYRISPYFDESCLCGLNTLDLILLQRHVLGIEDLDSPYGVIAGDLNNNFDLSAIDLVELKKLILGIYSEPPNNECWRFVDESQVFQEEYNPFPFNDFIDINNLSSSTSDQNFVAIKTGDVDGSCLLTPEYMGEIIIEADDQTVATGETVEVDIYSEDFLDVYGMQFTLSHAGLNLVDIISSDLNITNQHYAVITQGEVSTFSWQEMNPVSSNDIMFTMVFQGIEQVRLIDVLDMTSDIAIPEAYTTRDFLLNELSLIIHPQEADNNCESKSIFEVRVNSEFQISETPIGFEVSHSGLSPNDSWFPIWGDNTSGGAGYHWGSGPYAATHSYAGPGEYDICITIENYKIANDIASDRCHCKILCQKLIAN